MYIEHSSDIPEDDDDAVEDVEAVADVLVEAVGEQLERHLEGEDDAEGHVAHLDRLGEHVGLVVELDAHAEGVDEDAEEDEALEDVVVDEGAQAAPRAREAAAHAVQARLKLGWPLP